MIPPIPKRVLIHSADLITHYDGDKWGGSTSSETIRLEHIRIEPSNSTAIDGNGVKYQLSSMLFFDCCNSSPDGSIFALVDDVVNGRKVELQQIDFNGRLYTVKTISPLYDNARLHHYEVGLV